MKPDYQTVAKVAEVTYEIKKSVFIARCFPIETEEEAKALTEEVKKDRSATHHCSAYVVGLTSPVERFFDDGEPSGTAGMPILEVLRKREMTNVLVVVTRFFGGIKLGAPGLVRAYGQGASLAVEAAKPVVMKDYTDMTLTYDYTAHGRMEYLLMGQRVLLLDTRFTDKVAVDLTADSTKREALESSWTEATGGQICIDHTGHRYVPTLDGKPIEV